MSLKELDYNISYSQQDNPLLSFYIPVLKESQHYFRSTGYFSSMSLAVAGQGVAHLIKNEGNMRLLVGAQLEKVDVEAIKEGYDLQNRVRDRLLAALEDIEDNIAEKRLEILSWMIAEKLLEIKVVLPLDDEGKVMSALESEDYFHPKQGLFTDKEGNEVAFTGSINESVRGWTKNYEQFDVYLSWGRGREYLKETRRRLHRLWNDDEAGWKTISIPKAVEEELLKFKPTHKPAKDPLEELMQEKEKEVKSEESILFNYVKDAPKFPNSEWLGVETSAVVPWPHQGKVVEKVIDRFPERFMLCDEVGLGKTIEAGLVLRELLISGQIERVLLLVPKSLIKQWQEELYEKFQLEVPIYDGSAGYKDINNERIEVKSDNPWEAFPVMLASSHLAKRKERRAEILEANTWDLILVDEAHHARRKDFQEKRYRPNNLLELLMQLKNRTESMLLLTATPMQISPVEVFDLLRVLGIGGRWGASEDYFVRYYRELQLPLNDIDWEFMLNMFKDYLNSGGQISEDLEKEARDNLGLVEWEDLKKLPEKSNKRTLVQSVNRRSKNWLRRMLQELTPLTRFSFRNTRSLLYKYREKGLLKKNVPTRDPEQKWIKMSAAERSLYERIDEYISEFYKKYEEERQGLGFVMTVYRKRLTSSFYAMKESLRRRKRYLQGNLAYHGLLTDEDVETEDLQQDILEDEELLEERLELFEEEIEYIEDFLDELSELEGETKIEVLQDDINRIFRKWDKVIIFTQYTDTMDFIRNKLKLVYREKVACYSGRGGETWDSNKDEWLRTSKEEIKNDFLTGEKLKILVCTEAASEGLNLQTCGVLINYDMPWNPMKVEQRIGRIDRIGQKHNEVKIKNYFYEDTVEAKVYNRLGDRINWFEDVVGNLQPILGRVRDSIQEIAMSSREDRESEEDRRISELERSLDQRTTQDLDIDEALGSSEIKNWGKIPPVTLKDLEDLFISSKRIGHLFYPHPKIKNAYQLDLDGEEYEVTFDQEVYDKKPYTLELLTYQNSLFEKILDKACYDGKNGWELVKRIEVDGYISYYTLGEGFIKKINNYRDLVSTMKSTDGLEVEWTEKLIEEAKDDVRQEAKRKEEKIRKIKKERKEASWQAIKARSRLILSKAATIKGVLELGDLLDKDAYLRRGFNFLKEEQYPFTGLMKACGFSTYEELELQEDVLDSGERSLNSLFVDCDKRGKELLEEISGFKTKKYN